MCLTREGCVLSDPKYLEVVFVRRTGLVGWAVMHATSRNPDTRMNAKGWRWRLDAARLSIPSIRRDSLNRCLKLIYHAVLGASCKPELTPMR